MKLGAVFPQTDIGDDAGAVREWTLGVEALGFDHVDAYDHVIGANTASRPGWTGAYDLDSQFYEPFVMLSYMAALSTKLSFMTGVFILPQRQTVLFAKQAACLDKLCDGRLRLGVGTGWNAVEYEALGVDFAKRGDIFDDQIEVLRALWTKRAVTIETPYHKITDAGLKPMPVQRPIPLWLGGGGGGVILQTSRTSEKVIRRIARVADGWLPLCSPGDAGAELVARMHAYAREYGRKPEDIGIQAGLQTGRIDEDKWAGVAAGWKKLGATHMFINTMGGGLTGADQHLRRLEHALGVAKGAL
jgi:probable F420-dependent oxidoreductase